MSNLVKVSLVQFALSVGSNLFAQPPAESQLTIQPVKSISWKQVDEKGVQVLGDALESNNILVLAELNHGDGSSNDAQCMLLKGLIDSGKINSIYIESSWMNCEKIMSLLRDSGQTAIQETQKFMTSYDLKYWVSNGFWNYLVDKIIAGKVDLYGFDIEGKSSLLISELFNQAMQLDAVKKYSQENPKAFKDAKWPFDYFEGWGLQSVLDEKSYNNIKSLVDEIIKAYQQRGNQYRIQQWQSVLDYFYWMYKRASVLAHNKYANQIENDHQRSQFMAIRDSLMADIFIKKYTEKKGKAVCIMSTYHAIRNSHIVEGLSNCCKDESVKSMMEIVDQRLKEKVYSMCFISASGKRGINYYYKSNDIDKIKAPLKKSLEYYCERTKNDYGIIDFSQPELMNREFYMNATFNKYLRSRWSNNFSAAFYIREMAPLTISF